jgi:mRNA-degrading endonuclease RelE of RelBE toxin-antitoxin system
MKYEILFAPEALEDLKRLRKVDAATILDAVEVHLRHAPERVSKSRIKQLRGLHSPQYRMRVGEWRVFYDVAEGEVGIRGVVSKSAASDWLAQFGEPS